MRLTEQERHRIDERIRAFEARTGAQIVTAVVDRCDLYPEIPWKAFALGASVAALFRVLADILRPDWLTSHAALFDALTVLACGALLAAWTMAQPSVARLFLHGARAATEVMDHAWALFLRRELFATPQRNAVLILVSRFERRVAIVLDTRVRSRVADAELSGIIAKMMPALAASRAADALCEGVADVEALLVAKGFAADGTQANTLPDDVIEEGGPNA
jgi:putative membrane protein